MRRAIDRRFGGRGAGIEPFHRPEQLVQTGRLPLVLPGSGDDLLEPALRVGQCPLFAQAIDTDGPSQPPSETRSHRLTGPVGSHLRGRRNEVWHARGVFVPTQRSAKKQRERGQTDLEDIGTAAETRHRGIDRHSQPEIPPDPLWRHGAAD